MKEEFVYRNTAVSRREIESYPCPFCTELMSDEIIQTALERAYWSTKSFFCPNENENPDFENEEIWDSWFADFENELINLGAKYYDQI